MKSNLFALALAASSMPALAMGMDGTTGDGGFFVNGNVGRSDLNKSGIYNDNDFGYSANVGYRWAINPSVALGVEGGYTNLGSFQVMHYADPLGNLPNASVDGWNLGVNGRFNLSPNWYLSARGGFFHADAEGLYYHIGSGIELINVKTTSDRYYVGAGFGYNVSNNLSVGLNYDYYETHKDGLNLQPNMVSVSAEYRFK